MCRISGVNGPKLAHFRLKFGGHFYVFRASKTRFSVYGVGGCAGVLLRPVGRQP